jgi:hypothetical protein
MTTLTKSRLLGNRAKDYYGGTLILLVGLGAIVKGLSYNVGTFTQMGSGFFPTALGIILSLLGVGIALTASDEANAGHEDNDAPFDWRGPLCIALSIAAFVVLGRFGGLVPASFAVTFIAAMGDRQSTVKSSFLLAVAITVVSVVVFRWALGLQMNLFTWG